MTSLCEVWRGQLGGKELGLDSSGRVWWMNGNKWLSIVDDPMIKDAVITISNLMDTQKNDTP